MRIRTLQTRKRPTGSTLPLEPFSKILKPPQNQRRIDFSPSFPVCLFVVYTISKEDSYDPIAALPLPSFFQGMVVHLNDTSLPKDAIPVLYRYLIAYGAQVIEETIENATHICQSFTDTGLVKSERPVISPEWILACHAAQSLLPLDVLSRDA